MKNIQKILIANRGEIALRVITTARNLGYRTVAVFSDADAAALHVQEADEAVYIGGSSASESYLLVDVIIAAAISAQADAIHPGYGFLSENANFARACEQHNIVFIGPDAAAIELMGSKRLSKIAMLEAAVPCVPGYHGADQSDELLLSKARDIGLPLMIKASAGGGGRGMRLVTDFAEMAGQLKSARCEAKNAFGSDELILEKALIAPRHIEIQIFADRHGNAVHLGERDCSIQRRNQKVLEEAPSPFMHETLRKQMGQAAVNAARACHYVGAGTVEFLVDAQRNFYFLEMNTRLQVEHPVTELITGLDLVAWQISVAQGEPLPLRQEQIFFSGHAIEVRLYAEDPRNEFVPQTGQIHLWQLHKISNAQPATLPQGIRIDHGIAKGQTISPHYDPMLAKVIAHGDNRDMAARRLVSALQDIGLLGINNNKLFLQNILGNPEFLAGSATTAFLEQHFASDPSLINKTPSNLSIARCAVIIFQQSMHTKYRWSSAAGRGYQFSLLCEGNTYHVKLQASQPGVYEVTVAEQRFSLGFLPGKHTNSGIFSQQTLQQHCYFVMDGKRLFIDDGSGHFCVENITHQPPALSNAAGSGQVKAVMDGMIIELLVQVGDTVKNGQTLLILEAMKMQHRLKASRDGLVARIDCESGQQVKIKQILLTISGDEEV